MLSTLGWKRGPHNQALELITVYVDKHPYTHDALAGYLDINIYNLHIVFAVWALVRSTL